MNKEKRNKILKISLAVLAIICFSLIAFFVLRHFGLTDVKKLRLWISSCGTWGWLVFIILQTVLTILLCFVPTFSADFVMLGNLLFNDGTQWGMWKTSLICLASIMLSSTCMFLIGRYGGDKLVIKLVGKEDLEKAQKLISTKADVYLPLMYMFPIFPDDALACCAGMTKMKLWYHTLIATIFRGIGVVTICFLGSDFFHYETFTLSEWFEFLSACAFWLVACFYFAYKLDAKIENRKRKEDENK